jgi:hypothetical protein
MVWRFYVGKGQVKKKGLNFSVKKQLTQSTNQAKGTHRDQSDNQEACMDLTYNTHIIVM